MAVPVAVLAKAGPWLVKQLPKLWPLLLDAKNRERLQATLRDLASNSPTKRLRAQVNLTAVLAERMVDQAVSDVESNQAKEWNRQAKNLSLRLDMPVSGRDAKKAQRRAVQEQLQQLQAQMDQKLGD
jgi:hypothetical protein